MTRSRRSSCVQQRDKTTPQRNNVKKRTEKNENNENKENTDTDVLKEQEVISTTSTNEEDRDKIISLDKSTQCSSPDLTATVQELKAIISTLCEKVKSLEKCLATGSQLAKNREEEKAITNGSDGLVYATQYPRSCVDIQTSTSVPSSPYLGGILLLVSNLTCIPTTEEPGETSSLPGIIAGCVILFIIFVVAVLAIYHLGYRKRWPLLKQKVPCLKSTQVDPQSDLDGEDQDEVVPIGLLVSGPVNIATTAVGVSPRSQGNLIGGYTNKVKTTVSSRSVLTPSKLLADMAGDNTSVTITTISANTAATTNATNATNINTTAVMAGADDPQGDQSSISLTPRRLPPINNSSDLPELQPLAEDEGF